MTEDRLPDAELEVLACLQHSDSATAREVRRRIAPWRPLAHSSVMTLLGRLETRGLVRREPTGRGREFRFYAMKNRDDAVRPILKHLVSRVFEGDPAGLVASLYGDRKPTPDELDELDRLIDGLRREQDG